MKKISSDGINLIIDEEKFRAEAYQDHTGIWTIGYGHTATAYPGRVISKDEAVRLFRKDIEIKENCVNNNVVVGLTQQQFDALVSLTYNIGCTNFRKSTLLKKLNQRDYHGAYLEFPKWNKAGGEVLRGLVNRRAKEQELWAKGGEKPESKPLLPFFMPKEQSTQSSSRYDNYFVYGSLGAGIVAVALLWKSLINKNSFA